MQGENIAKIAEALSLDASEQLHRVVDQLLEPYGKTSTRTPAGFGSSGRSFPPFDISRPNEHETKAEFQREFDIVRNAKEHIEQLIDLLVPGDKDEEKHLAIVQRLRSVVDQKLRQNPPDKVSSRSIDLVRKSVADVGGYVTSLAVMVDLHTVFSERYRELEDQREKFWNLPHRAPDYYARAIALRLAKHFCRLTGEYPTYGTSGETGEASTPFSRALKDVFFILGIEAGERSYAEWAVSQLTERDIEPRKTGLLGGFFGPPLAQSEEEILQTLRREKKKKGPRD